MSQISKQDVHEAVKKSDYTFTDFSKHVANYLEVEWDDKFKERIYQCVAPSGHGSPSEQEWEVIEYWYKVQSDPHTYARMRFKAKGYERKSKILSEYLLNKRSYNLRSAKEMVRYFRGLIK